MEEMLISNLTILFYLKDYTITTKVIPLRVEIAVERTQRGLTFT